MKAQQRWLSNHRSNGAGFSSAGRLIRRLRSPMPKTLKVLIVGPSPRFTGGQAVQADRLIQALKSVPDLQVDFQALDPKLPGPLGWLQKIKYLRTLISEPAYICALFARIWRYDVIHIFSAGTTSFALSTDPPIRIAKLFGRKSLVNYRDGRAEEHLQNWPSAVRLLKKVDRIVPPSGFLVEVFAKFGLRAQFISNIIDTAKFTFRERARPQPRFFSNRGMEPLYNIPCTLKAFAIIQEKYPEASLVLAHDGPLRPQMEAMVREMNLRNVQFLGFVDQTRMPRLYADAEIYLMSPNIDNMPGSILECYACGLPLVSTAAGGVPFIVDDGRTGLLVPLDDHQAMAQAALRLMEEPGLASSLTKAGLAECEHYRGPEIARQWAALYRELMQGDIS